MSALRLQSRSLLAACFAALVAGCAQAPANPTYVPRVGQEGKDVIWVPTPPAMVEKMLDMAQVGRDDFVMDLGSGDGRNVIAAARRGARALGVEFNPDMVEFSRRTAAREGVADKAKFVQGDMYAADISAANVLALFLLPDNLRRLTPKFLDLKPGSRIVVNFFGMEGWQADETVQLTSDCEPWCLVMLYIVPAKVAGTWRLPQGELVLEQKFQMVWGTLVTGGGRTEIGGGRLRGDQIRFSAGGIEYSARVSGDRMTGDMKGNAAGAWTATRVTR